MVWAQEEGRGGPGRGRVACCRCDRPERGGPAITEGVLKPWCGWGTGRDWTPGQLSQRREQYARVQSRPMIVGGGGIPGSSEGTGVPH